MAFGRSSNVTAAGMVRFLFLCCVLAFSTFLFWMLYVSGFPLVLSIAAGVSTASHTIKGTNVRSYDLFIVASRIFIGYDL
jgi:hypothetical protein